jgi:hypothetical protein
MTFKHNSALACLTLLAQLAIVHASDAGEWFFRGIPREQTNDLGSNKIESPVLTRVDNDFYVDIEDRFSRNGALAGSLADIRVSQLVAPFDGVPLGWLTGDAANAVGRWSGDTDYVVSDGRLQRDSGLGIGVTHVPWRVTERLGDDYLLEVSAVVADGETARIGYLADPSLGTNRGLESELGELTMSVSRIDGRNLEWAVSWNMDDGSRQRFSSILTTPTDTTGEELNLQLGWEDVLGSNNDLFDAWLQTSTGNTQLLAGNMATSIDVHAVGLELTGPESYIVGFRAAVPEPNALGLTLVGILGLVGLRRRCK